MKTPSINVVGPLIKKYRLDQNMSQESLCQGICVVSYLSKIESGSVTPSNEILDMLFKALGIQYYSDKDFILKGEIYFKDFFHAYFYKHDDLLEQLIQQIEPYADKYLFSPLLLEYLLFKAYCLIASHALNKYSQDIASILDSLSPYNDILSSDQLYRFYLCLGFVKVTTLKDIEDGFNYLTQANQIKKTAYGLFTLAYAYYIRGNYAHSIHINEEAFNLATQEGNILVAIDICLALGASNANMSNTFLMLKYYNQGLNLCEGIGNHKLKGYIYYNLGATYLTLNDNDTALSYCLKSLEIFDRLDDYSISLYHKLSIIYYNLGYLLEANLYLNKAYDTLNANPCEDSDMLLLSLDIVKLRLTDSNYLISASYLHLLETIYHLIGDKIHFGHKQFHGHYLIECYKANRRYKDALRITEELYVPSFKFY